MIYNHKTEGKSWKDFSRYQNPIDIFINLRDGNINPREVLKNQTDFKSDLKKSKKSKKEIRNQNQRTK